MRKSMMSLVRKSKHKVRGSGFLATWDVDSADRATAFRLWSFLFGRTVRVDGREYEYEGFVWKDGVRYVGQSVVFVLPHRLNELVTFLSAHGIDHDIDSSIFTQQRAAAPSHDCDGSNQEDGKSKTSFAAFTANRIHTLEEALQRFQCMTREDGSRVCSIYCKGREGRLAGCASPIDFPTPSGFDGAATRVFVLAED